MEMHIASNAYSNLFMRHHKSLDSYKGLLLNAVLESELYE